MRHCQWMALNMIVLSIHSEVQEIWNWYFREQVYLFTEFIFMSWIGWLRIIDSPNSRFYQKFISFQIWFHERVLHPNSCFRTATHDKVSTIWSIHFHSRIIQHFHPIFLFLSNIIVCRYDNHNILLIIIRKTLLLIACTFTHEVYHIVI